MVYIEKYPIPVARLMMGTSAELLRHAPSRSWPSLGSATACGPLVRNKKRQVTYIAPLRPLTLAAFRPWGGSAGAGRIRLAGHKDTYKQLTPA